MTNWIVTILHHLKTQEIFNEAVEEFPFLFAYAPDHFKTKEMCNKVVHIEPRSLAFIADHFKTQEMCDKAVRDDSSSLQFVPDWFVKREGLYIWHEDYYDNDGGHCVDDDDGDKDKFFDWYDGYKKRKAQKTSIKEELLPITWHPSRYWDWCMSEDEKKETEKLWA